jgi:acyl-CoA synthetase (AMP-forming)/AMP-acid ligase II
VAGAVTLIRRERCTTLAGWATLQQQIRELDDRTPGGAPSSLLPVELPPGAVSSGGHPRNVGMSETFGPHADPRYFEYKIVDPATGERVPDGGEGEFCVRGFGLMAGMVKREREELFDEDGYYRTGDRGYVEGGHIFFTGRFSEMIKTGGANVAPPEVEGVLLGFPDVAEAYVVGVPDPDRGEEVVALVVAVAGASVEPVDLQARVRAELSAYKVPRRIVVVDHDQVPLLGTGKPDRRAMRIMLAVDPL